MNAEKFISRRLLSSPLRSQRGGSECVRWGPVQVGARAAGDDIRGEERGLAAVSFLNFYSSESNQNVAL